MRSRHTTGTIRGSAICDGEQGVAPRQEVDLARGVPPGQDQGILGRMLDDGDRQCGKFGKLAVERDEQFAGAVLPVEQDGRALAAPGGMCQWPGAGLRLRYGLHSGRR